MPIHILLDMGDKATEAKNAWAIVVKQWICKWELKTAQLYANSYQRLSCKWPDNQSECIEEQDRTSKWFKWLAIRAINIFDSIAFWVILRFCIFYSFWCENTESRWVNAWWEVRFLISTGTCHVLNTCTCRPVLSKDHGTCAFVAVLCTH